MSGDARDTELRSSTDTGAVGTTSAVQAGEESSVPQQDSLEFHPISETFPLIDGEQYEELKADIEANGLRVPIVLYQGKILDGRNRYRACRGTGQTPRFELYEGVDPLGHANGLNLKRRHLTISQRAIIAARQANMRSGTRTDLEPPAPMPEVGKSAENGDYSSNKSQAEAAEMFNVSDRVIRNAKTVLDEGGPDEISAIEQGEETVGAVVKRVRARSKDESAPKENGAGKRHQNHVGARINVPEGMTAEELCRKGMAIESDGTSSEEVARELSISASSYRGMRDIVMLHDRDDLREADAHDVSEALNLMNETNRLSEAYQHVKPLVERIWGVNRRASRSQAETRRIEQFEHSIRLIADNCDMFADQVDIPYLSDEQASKSLNLLKEAEKKLKEVRARIEETIS